MRLRPAVAATLAALGAAAITVLADTRPHDLVDVPAGTLRMGSTEGAADEQPVHEVFVPAFRIDRREVTNAEFAAFVAETGHRTDAERSGEGWHWVRAWAPVPGASWRRPYGPGSDLTGRTEHPVVQVSWHDAQAYCRWRGARLPTEAEWERAARGAGGRRYAWGDEAPDAGGVHRASYGSNRCCSADRADGYLRTAPVGSYPAGRTPLGVEDLTGNVWEWVEDTDASHAYTVASGRLQGNAARGDGDGPRRVIRGGGWGNDPWGLRATLRHANPPGFALSMVGVRCAAGSADPPPPPQAAH